MTATLGKIIADFNTTLNLKVAVGATSATLDSATDDDGIALPTGTYFLTYDGNSTTSKEYIVCTLTGTALTSIQSVSRQGALTSGFARTHRKGATITITDFAIIKKMLDNLDGTTGFNSLVPLGYDGAPSLSAGTNKFATVLYADNLAIAGSPKATDSTYGISKLSTVAVDALIPIVVGDNDARVPTTGENNALVGNNTDVAVGTGNKFVTQTGLQHAAEQYAADAGANDTYVITLSPVPTSYTNGMPIRFKANTANTGTATINVNSLGAKTIVKGVNTTLADGDIAAGQLCTLIYDGTNFVLQSPIANVYQAYTTGFGSVSSATADGAGHQVTADSFLFGSAVGVSTGATTVAVKTDSGSTPTTTYVSYAVSNTVFLPSFCIPVKKNDYYLISSTGGSGATISAFLRSIT